MLLHNVSLYQSASFKAVYRRQQYSPVCYRQGNGNQNCSPPKPKNQPVTCLELSTDTMSRVRSRSGVTKAQSVLGRSPKAAMSVCACVCGWNSPHPVAQAQPGLAHWGSCGCALPFRSWPSAARSRRASKRPWGCATPQWMALFHSCLWIKPGQPLWISRRSSLSHPALGYMQ